MMKRLSIGLMVVLLAQTSLNLFGQTVYEIQPHVTYVTAGTFSPAPGPGDIVKIMAPRSEGLKFVGLQGDAQHPILFINSGGQVNINTSAWGALEFLDCQYIKVSGSGDPSFRYGIKLFGSDCGLAFSGLSSDCEAEFIEILGDNNTFFGIVAKEDFKASPPDPYPQFNNLIIHDNYIHGVSEGMYIGETVSPGMEFRHVRIYNNVVEDTHRECIQIANCVEDVEIHNNLLRNSGLHLLDWQENNLLIGGNSVAKVYNNILQDGPGFGIEILGMGNIEVFNNYVQNNKGIFIDNRYWTLENTPIIVKDNYFTEQTSWEVVKNMNEFNDLHITGNQYNSNNIFFYNASATPPVMVVENNTQQYINPLNVSVEQGLYVRDANIPSEFRDLGPVYPPVQFVERIQLNPTMLIDLVPGGSFKSPLTLIDEQYLNPELDQHPRGKQWKPARNNDNAPYLVEIDLGSPHYLEMILLHDYRRSGEMIISYFENGNWQVATSDQLTQENVWNEHKLELVAQKIRLSMNDWQAFINEIALYGYSMNPSMKSSDINDPNTIRVQNIAIEKLKVFPNPASGIINIQSSFEELASAIFDNQGRMILRSKEKQIDISELVNGIYFLKTVNVSTGHAHVNRLIIRH